MFPAPLDSVFKITGLPLVPLPFPPAPYCLQFNTVTVSLNQCDPSLGRDRGRLWAQQGLNTEHAHPCRSAVVGAHAVRDGLDTIDHGCNLWAQAARRVADGANRRGGASQASSAQLSGVFLRPMWLACTPDAHPPLPTWSCRSAITAFVTPFPFLTFFCSASIAAVRSTPLARLQATDDSRRTGQHERRQGGAQPGCWWANVAAMTQF